MEKQLPVVPGVAPQVSLSLPGLFWALGLGIPSTMMMVSRSPTSFCLFSLSFRDFEQIKNVMLQTCYIMLYMHSELQIISIVEILVVCIMYHDFLASLRWRSHDTDRMFSLPVVLAEAPANFKRADGDQK